MEAETVLLFIRNCFLESLIRDDLPYQYRNDTETVKILNEVWRAATVSDNKQPIQPITQIPRAFAKVHYPTQSAANGLQ